MSNIHDKPEDFQVLSERHYRALHVESGIADEKIAARGYRTITNVKELVALDFANKQLRQPGLLLPLHATDGSIPLYVYRPDHPREIDGKILKYEIPKGAGVRLDCPPSCRPFLADPSIPLWITEGQKKADSLASRGACAIALLGVWGFKGRNSFGGTTFLNDWDHIALNDRDVRFTYDSDVMRKTVVRQALERLSEHLQRKGAHVSSVYLPLDIKGVDDYLVAGHSLDDLEKLIEGPRPQPQPAKPTVELLDESPLTMRRPLALLNGHAYGAIWPHVRITETEATTKDGTIIKLPSPYVKTEQRLFVVRDDGRVFGDGGDDPLSALGFTLHLPEIPPPDKLWSAPGVKAYKAGYRPDPANVFSRIVEVVNHFIDFDRSLADQRTMCEMVACFIEATWFLDAFTVIGFLWPNGDRGSGKTQFLTITCELSYLGQVVLSGGTYASLRDLADYGACLGFDDAEHLSDPKQSDPDKRNLLLAGNRRGNVVPVKEPGPDRTWRTRYISTFCPRLFSAIRLPDAVLASRTTILPLIRTADRSRANADPVDYKVWPHDRRTLIDDLWAISLAHMAQLSSYESRVNADATLTGRNLEPWRAILAVALWLNDHGMKGLWERMEQLSRSYQNEKPELESADITALVIRALCQCAINAISAIRAINLETHKFFKEEVFKTADVVAAAKYVIGESELDIDPETVTNRRVGRVLGRMRLRQEPRSGGQGSRLWKVTLNDLLKWTELYSVPFPDSLHANGTNGFNGSNGTTNGVDESFNWETGENS
jgi:Domain of unknown function (DUF3854)